MSRKEGRTVPRKGKWHPTDLLMVQIYLMELRNPIYYPQKNNNSSIMTLVQLFVDIVLGVNN